MENFSYHVPFYVVTGGVATSGHSSELTAGRVGLFDRQTFSVATSIGNGKEFFFAQGAIGGFDWYGQPIRESHKSPFFFGKDVEDFYLSRPERIVNEEWVIGFNGAESSNSLSFATGVPTRIKFYFHGQPIYRFFNGPKEYVVSYTPLEDCTTPCEAGDCPEGIADCLTHTQNLINLINTHTELRKFGVTAGLVNDPYVATTPNMEKYCLDVCDNGDAIALQRVQAQYPLLTITRTGRAGSISTYEFCQPEPDDAPADFTQAGDVLLAVCGECEAGTTTTEARDVYFITRALLPSDDTNDDVARQTYADAVGTAYEAATAQVFDGATDVEVVASSDAITITDHGFQTGNRVVYTDGGDTQIVGLTDTNTYFIIKVDDDTVKLASSAANAYAGTAIAIADGVGAAHALTPTITATFVANIGGQALIKLKVGEGIDLSTPLLSDSSAFVTTEAAVCTYSAATPISWTACGTGIRASRTLRIKNINREDCDGGDRLADLTTILAGVQGIQIDTLAVEAGVDCKDDYTVDQYSIDCVDEGCLTNAVTFTYATLPSFENESWEVVPEATEENADRRCGIRVTAGYIDPRFGNCSFDPMDYYETEPIKMEVSLLQEDGDRCDAANWPTVSQSRIGRISRQSGEYIVREVIMKTDAYLKHMDQFSMDPRTREAFDQNLLSMVDRTAYYDLYYVRYKASYGRSFRKNEQEKFTTVFAFKEGDPTAATFQTAILDVLTAKSGVTLHINGENNGGSSGQQS